MSDERRTRFERWDGLSVGLTLAVWAAQVWVMWDPDLQGVQDAIGWWMVAVFFAAPCLFTLPVMLLFDEPGVPGDTCGAEWPEESGGSRIYCGGG
ncbi:hypothetical protein ACQKM2_22790 [Streptomyces sp. NPDC004126]|uniref:hypothetical protein n=1 Tax=Streptomyces sp. NPDC004126 TaxID=3390695 RepID=UPI003D04CE84